MFVGSDLVIVCAENSFLYSFAANDNDGDQRRYSFCAAYQSGTSGNGTPPPSPPYQSVPYGSGFSSSAPLGNNVQINQFTGLITGIAPAEGIYVVTVCVEEIRNGQVIATQRKDLQINITSCSIAAAMLYPEYMLCRNTKTISISNLSTSPLISTSYWEITNHSGLLLFTSNSETLTYTFSDTGIYMIKLVINRNQACSDSTTSIARVYPGFFPGFYFTGICFTKPTKFTDTSTTVYGVVDSWNWDFGEITTITDVSNQKNPMYTYPTMEEKNAQLIVTNSKGCRDTVIKNILIVDKPPISLAFRDTLICLNDAVQLQAGGNGNFTWSPPINLINLNSATPTATPQLTTMYFVDLDDNGCRNRDSVKVRVVDHVTFQAMTDTTICQGDTIQLRVASDGFQYSWTPASQLIDPTIQNPYAITNANTTYTVTARIGGCSATEAVVVVSVPYPLANAGTDTTICFKYFAQLFASTDGSSVIWSPAASLNNTSILNPVAIPTSTTSYVLSAFDTKGCPKPGRDTVLVNVLPDINAFCGRDTSVVVGQPLQLNASGGINYSWSPPTGLSETNISDPIAIYNSPSDHVQYKVMVFNEAGCADSAFVKVAVYKTLPTVFVPSAFTPNNDGKNDYLRPIPVGIAHIEYFNVYNRWGQLVYSSGLNGRGWDGRISGLVQGTGVFIWIVKAVDYKGAPYYQKGTVTLIR